MLTDQEIYLCSKFDGKIEAASEKIHLGGTPKNMQRISNESFLICDPSTDSKKTRFIEMKVRRKNQDTDELII